MTRIAAVEPITAWRPRVGIQVRAVGHEGVHLVLKKITENFGPLTATWELLGPDAKIIKALGTDLCNPYGK